MSDEVCIMDEYNISLGKIIITKSHLNVEPLVSAVACLSAICSSEFVIRQCDSTTEETN